MTYCFKCNVCGNKVEVTNRNRHPVCHCGTTMVRDYRTELDSQSVFIPLHMSSRNTSSKTDFLPTTKDFEGPSDPTGENGMKDWKDTHQRVGFREV